MDYETILSTFDKRITLLQWLKQLTELLKDIKTEEEVTAESVNPVESKGIYTFVTDNIAILRNALETAIAMKQDILMSGQNIKTVNGVSLLGSGDLQAGTKLYKHKLTWKLNQMGTILDYELTFISDVSNELTSLLQLNECFKNHLCSIIDNCIIGSQTHYGIKVCNPTYNMAVGQLSFRLINTDDMATLTVSQLSISSSSSLTDTVTAL